MANVATSTASNVLYMARCKAATHNESLNSRENAADMMSIDRGRLYRIEKGVADPYPEEIHLMADLYSAPELRNWYCRSKCPLGKNFPAVEDLSIDRISIKALSSLRKVSAVKESLLDIVEDGTVQENEKAALQEIIKTLDEINEINQNLKNWAEKYLK